MLKDLVLAVAHNVKGQSDVIVTIHQVTVGNLECCYRSTKI